jgi:glycosyltransferase involved in cell wall biosynthesis
VILFLHNRYRTTGGEERVVDDLLELVREHLGEEVELLERDSAALGRSRAAIGMLRGGLKPEDVAAAVRRTGARIVHAHNVNPSFGWRALAAARAAGAQTVLHLHNYRLVCAVGTCFTKGEDCTRCHARNTWPGVRLACRGDRAEAAVYGAGLALWQQRLAEHVDRFVVPSQAALDRLGQLGAPLGDRAGVVSHPVHEFAADSIADQGKHALVTSRLAPEKGVDIAIEAAGHS